MFRGMKFACLSTLDYMLCSQLIGVWCVQVSRDCEILQKWCEIFWLEASNTNNCEEEEGACLKHKSSVSMRSEKGEEIKERVERESGRQELTSRHLGRWEWGKKLTIGVKGEGKCVSRSGTVMLMWNIGAERSNVLKNWG